MLDPSTTPSDSAETRDLRKRWLALLVLCLGTVMIVLDTTIVNVALPSIRTALLFSETSLVWVVNAYMLTFGGFLLLSGRLGDLYGQRRIFIGGIVLFTLASLACGLSRSQSMLVASRAVQGVGGSAVSAISLSLIMNLFPEPGERAKAMGVYSFVCAGGGSVGVLLGGLLVQSLDWHWIFLVNIPIGMLVVFLTLALVAERKSEETSRHLDIAGALCVTTSLMLAVYGIVGGNQAGWGSGRTLGLLATSAVLLAIFLGIESRVKTPLLPLRLLGSRNLSTANTVGVLWAAGMFAWFFLSALYMQLVLGCTAMQVGLAFLPANLIMAAFSLGLSAKIVTKFGNRLPLAGGLLLAACGLLLFARVPLHGSIAIDVLPAMSVLGLGAGIALNPMLLAAMSDVEPGDSGLASGIVNTSFMMGGGLGLAVLASVAAARTKALTDSGAATAAALLGGYHVAFVVGAIFAAGAGLLGGMLLRDGNPAEQPDYAEVPVL
ncbi:MAG TPA: MFS transporter [Fibrobacteria bacterium]|nr:MFS transporter [Fibrobacteria bacterium]